MGNLFSSQPKPKPAPGPDPTGAAKGLLPGATADAAARLGGGISPQFLQNILGQQTGAPPANLNVLSDIRRTLNLPTDEGG